MKTAEEKFHALLINVWTKLEELTPEFWASLSQEQMRVVIDFSPWGGKISEAIEIAVYERCEAGLPSDSLYEAVFHRYGEYCYSMINSKADSQAA
ncbi:MAG: hypothetical protein WCP18_01805 [bacterium]